MPAQSPLKDVVQALKDGFNLSWTPMVGGQCGACEKTGGLCGHYLFHSNISEEVLITGTATGLGLHASIYRYS
jgi:hypothetical protein